MGTYRALVTNDDGIHSQFLHHLVEALLPNFTVSVAAPKKEQSRLDVLSVDIQISMLKKITIFFRKRLKLGA